MLNLRRFIFILKRPPSAAASLTACLTVHQGAQVRGVSEREEGPTDRPPRRAPLRLALTHRLVRLPPLAAQVGIESKR